MTKKIKDQYTMDKGERSNLQVPGHHLMEVNVGEFIINSSVDGSYVAVVSRPLIKVPVILI